MQPIPSTFSTGASGSSCSRRQAAGSSSPSSRTVIFLELADHYNNDLCRFEFKTVGERNKALKLLEMRGFDVELVEDLGIYAVKLPRYSKNTPVLKNSVAMIETPDRHIFLMKDLSAVEEAERQGAKLVDVEVKF